MFARQFTRPEHSFLLLGARGTGKTTWIEQHFVDAARHDLMLTEESPRRRRAPSVLPAECAALDRSRPASVVSD